MGNQNSSKGHLVHPPVNWTQSFPREHKRLKKYGATAENKVLPQRIPGQRLRPTENGHILQTKGTISGRRINEFHAPHHPAFPPPMPLHHQPPGMPHPHSASMTALHYPCHQDERAASIHDLRFGRPPSKNYASEPDLRGSASPSVAPMSMPHTIISQSPTKGRIKSKKKYKAPPVPQGEMSTHSLPRGAMRSHSVSDMAGLPHPSHSQNHCAVHFADSIDKEITSSPEGQKRKTRKIGLFRKNNESRRLSSGDDQRSSGEEQERGRASSEARRGGAISPVRYSPREELRERARSLDCLQHELRQSPVVSPVPTAAASMTHLHHPQESRMWSTLERDSRRSARHEVESRRSSTLERESRKSANDSKRITTLEREVQKSHRRMSTLERKVEERKHWTSDSHDNATPSSSSRVSRLDSYRDSSSHRRSSSSGSHPELIQEEIEMKKKEEDRLRSEKEKMKVNKKNSSKAINDEWEKEAEMKKNNNRKLSPSLQAELIHTVNNLRKTSVEQEHKTSTLTRKGKENDRWPANPTSNHSEDVGPIEAQPKTFFFGMEPEVSKDLRSETNTGLHKIKNQEEVSKARNQEEVHINGQTVEFSRRTLERAERSQSRNRSTRKEKTSEITSTAVTHESSKLANHRKLSKDVEDFAVAIERYKMSRLDGESGASGSSRREDGGYHSRQNSGSLYLDNESDGREEGGLCMNLRPTLPRRQLEIPRFSPNAAWRSLSLERSGRHADIHEETQSSEGPDSVFESKIQRFTRPTAPPRGSGEKSADSGISGDAGSPGPTHEFEHLMPTEKTKSSSGPLAVSSPVVSGRAEGRRAWTPAQDLDDNSLDSNGEPADIPTGLSTPPKLTSRSNMFPKTKELSPDAEMELESPGEIETISELISPDDKDHWSKPKKLNAPVVHPQKFNSLRKLKRSVSGAVTGGGHKNYGPDDYHRSKTPDQPRGLQHGDDSHWRDNWSMSRSIPNSLNTCEEQDTISNLSSTRNMKSRSESRIGLSGDTNPDESRSRTPSYLMYGNGGHIMYLPQYDSRRMSHGTAGSEDEVDHYRSPHHKDSRYVAQYSGLPSSPENERKPPSGDEDPALPEAYCGSASIPTTAVAPPPRKLKGKKFSYQSTVRILEMRKLEEKLTREVAEKEKQRIKEMDAMKKVEEEFQRKREREKKKVKQQLKLFHMQQQQQQKLQQSPQHMPRETHNNSYSSDDHPPSSYSSEQHEVSSQASSQPPPLPRSPPPQMCSSFTSLPPELPTEACSGLISGIKSWVKSRKEIRSSTSSTTLTSGSRQEPDGAPASSPRKTSDDYHTSGASSPKDSVSPGDPAKQDMRAEIIAASKKRNADNLGRLEKQQSGKSSPQQKSVSILSNVGAKQEGHHSQTSPPDASLHHHHNHHQKHSKHHSKEDARHSQPGDKRRFGTGLMQELSELHQERREYREYRTPSRHSRHSQSPPVGTPGSPLVPVGAMKSSSTTSSNYRRDFCRGNAQVIGLNVVAMKGRRSDESDRYSKHSSEDRRSVSSSGIQRSASVDFLETGSCSSSTSSPSHPSGSHPADPSLSHNYGRGGGSSGSGGGSGGGSNGGGGGSGYPPVDSSPARFAHSILTPYNPVKGYRPVSFSPPPPTKILPVS
ncbi:LOW QUALITY PROTEIN: serine/arginine repetitive matrix protein 2-like [Portunus trituberculatus]|uniref:LOW QUALITY PROTEIN: serine/arginine repetitive matrix protein 2-like n=1 Tax=Portunus trituberculatus TaxID=210409 RepID=UPI001E1CB994|nr:LOW QUALITY PROTEIN: serine/arginine repetitive matrix protein 2-like [Portunus trituberculatus]